MPRHAAIRIDDDLAPGQTGVAERSAGYEAARRIDEEAGALIEQLYRHDGPHDLVNDGLLNRRVIDIRRVLRRHDNRVDAVRATIAIFNGHLALGVGAQPG